MILIALGSNLGNREAYLARATQALAAHAIAVAKSSPVVETPALLMPDAPPEWNQPYLNQVLEVHTTHDALHLLEILKSIETQLGRTARGVWAPREIDLDLLSYDRQIIDTPSLALPHPRLHERLFVMQPIYHIAPEWKHPLLNLTARELLAKLRRPKLLGIVNVTPDSFSGDGHGSETQAIAHAEKLLADGADILDIGAESTRPGAIAVDAATEWQRLQPVIMRLATRAPVSVDTRHAETAIRAIDAGAAYINDVSGFAETAMRAVLKAHSVGAIAMHSLTVPADPTITFPVDSDPVAEILAWKSTLKLQENARLIFDPGIGFGKTAQQSWALVERAQELVASGGAWLFGHSRKSFMKIFTDANPEERDHMTLKFSIDLACAGVQYLRVHNIALHRAFWG